MPCSAAPASAPTPASDSTSKQLARFAQTSFAEVFSARNNAFYVACPYALGTYSFIELSGIRQVYRVLKPTLEQEAEGVVARRELLFEPKKVRYYWDPGHKWVGGDHPPALTYFAELHRDATSRQSWHFRAEQHVCARGEPQEKPGVASIPK